MYWRKLFAREYGLPIPDNRFEPGFMKRLFASCTPRVGDLLEVVDTVHKWVVCRVIAVLNRTQFLVYFEGWAEIYIMWVDKVRDAQRIRPIHKRHLTGMGESGPVTEDDFNRMVVGATAALSLPVTEWPIPPCSYLPCLYYSDIVSMRLCNLKIHVKDPERVARLQVPREPQYVPTKVLQARMPPLWLGNFPHASSDPFYSPECRATHNYTHEPYPEGEVVPTTDMILNFHLQA